MSCPILNSEHATVLSAPDISTTASCAAMASNLFGALVNGIHSVRARRANTWMPNHSLDSQQMMSEMAILRKRSEKELRTSLDIAAPEVVGNLNCCSSFIKSQVEAPF